MSFSCFNVIFGLALLQLSTPDFIGLGSLTGVGYDTQAIRLSSDGTTVVGTSFAGDGYKAFRWRQSTGIQALPRLSGGAAFAEALGVSGNGDLVAGRSSSGNSSDEAFVWTEGSGITSIGDLPGGVFHSIATGVSDSGESVVGFSSSAPYPDSSQAFHWTASTGLIGLPDLPGGAVRSSAWDISGNGDVIVGASSSGATGVNDDEPVYWDSNGVHSLGQGLPGGNGHGRAMGVSQNGDVIVGYASGLGTEAFRWSAATGMVSLGDITEDPSLNQVAWDVSADGNMIVGQNGTGFSARAFLWTPDTGMVNLQAHIESLLGEPLVGWTLTEARSVSADGSVIAGIGFYNYAGNQIRTEGWIVRIPEPSTVALVFGAMLILSMKRK